MQITKRGSIIEVERQKLEKTKKEIEDVKNFTRECDCQYCASKFVITINDIARVYHSVDDDEIGSYGCACPVCEREHTFAARVLPMRGPKVYDFNKRRTSYENSPGYEILMEILHNNRVEYCDGVDKNGRPLRENRGIFRKRYYM